MLKGATDTHKSRERVAPPVAAHDRYVRRAVLRYAATSADSGPGCSDLPVREARMDHDGCPR